MGQREPVICMGINTELLESGSKDPVTWDKGFN